MALQVWLPLNGNLNNYGLDDITFITSTVGGYEAGKIGQALKGLGTNIGFYAPSLENLTTFSVAFWFQARDNSSITTNWLNVLSIYSKSADESIGVEWRFESSYANAYYLSSHNNAGYPINEGSGILIPQRNKWYYIVATCDGDSYVKYYVDAVLKKTTAYNGGHLSKWSSGCNVLITNESTKPDCLLNDLRIYDHCLSVKEIKELSKGLMAHYPLNDFTPTNLYEYGNLIPNYREMPKGTANVDTGTWRNAGSSTMTRNRVQIQDSPVGICYGFENSGTQTANDGSCYGIDSVTYFEPNTEYRISMFARITDGTEAYAGFYIKNISSELGGSHTRLDYNFEVTPLKDDGSWVYCWYHIKTNSSTTRNIYIGITTGETSVTTQMCLVRIEKWQDWFEDDIIYDTSGYCNNGINIGAVVEADSPRYLSSLSFDGVGNYVRLPNTAWPIVFKSDFSVCFWSRVRDTTRSILFSNYNISGSGNFFCIEIYSNLAVRLWWTNSGTDGHIDKRTFGTVTLNEWSHLAIVFSNSIFYVYINGKLGGSVAYTGTEQIPDTATEFRLGADGRTSGENILNGNLSDVRVYATALSAEDIKELYQTSASVDQNGRLFSYELVED